jgi:GT2 family glycosyltransferase
VPHLDILIVSYNAEADLAACLRSIRRHAPAMPSRTVVIDNASTDGSVQRVRSEWPEVRLIQNATNMGFAAGVNVGFRATHGDLVLLLNSDTIVPAGFLDRLVAELLKRPDVAVIGPRLRNEHGHPELSFGRMLSPVSELRQKIVTRLAAAGFQPAVRWIASATSREQLVDWVSGACLLVRRADAAAVGFLDERYFMYCEDVDFCAAIRNLGRRICFIPTVEIVHHRGRSVASAPISTERAYRRSQLAFYAKHRPAWVPWLRAYLRVRGKLPPGTADT